MLGRLTGQPTDQHKIQTAEGESWQSRKFGDPVAQCRNDAAFARSSRFKYPLTVSLFFREAISESTARRALTFHEGLKSPDAAMKRYDLPWRLAGIADGQLSPAAVESKIRSIRRIEKVKNKIRQSKALNTKDTKTVIRWIWSRIKHTNCWNWPSVNLAFGALRRLGRMKQNAHRKGLVGEEALVDMTGEYPGADPVLNLLTYLTRPDDLVLDFFAGSGATGDACRHFLDPRWRGDQGQWIWWNHWCDRHAKGCSVSPHRDNLDDLVLPGNYWEQDHSRKCLQYDIEPNPMALEDFGRDFVLRHDVVNGITDDIICQVKQVHPEGASLVYLDPPYVSQADYCNGNTTEGNGRFNAAARSDENNLCRMPLKRYVEVLARLISECERILAPNGRIALFMGLDARQDVLFDPAIEVFKAIQAQYSRWNQVPFELDRSGPLYDRVWVLSHGYELGAQIQRKRARGQVANVQRNIWILKRRDKGSSEPLV